MSDFTSKEKGSKLPPFHTVFEIRDREHQVVVPSSKIRELLRSETIRVGDGYQKKVVYRGPDGRIQTIEGDYYIFSTSYS